MKKACQPIESKQCCAADRRQWSCFILHCVKFFAGELQVENEFYGWRLHDANDGRLSIRMNKKVARSVESGAVDDIKNTKPETRPGHINRARQSMHIARLAGGIIRSNDT